MARALKRIESIVPRRAVGFGGKALGLATLARAGFPVPAGYAMPGWVCESFCRQVLPEEERPKALVHADALDLDELGQIAQRVRDAPLPPYVRRAVTDATRTLRNEGATAFAVRSSAAYEDQAEFSAAGIHRTCLNLQSDDEVLDAIKTCWASVFEPRAIEYMRNLTHEPNATVGIVLQAMVPADVAGVLFTCNPLTGDASEVVINAAYGLGLTVADGRVAPDTFRLDKASGEIRDEVLGSKMIRAVPSPTGGVREEKTDREERGRRSLDATQLEQLLLLARRIEDHFRAPRDVEWAIAGNEVYLLQARPVTVGRLRGARRGAKREPGRDRSQIVWSNANVGEALPGVATPLTWSVLSNFSDLGFRRAFGALGCTVPKDAELVGDFRGRIYLNMSEITSILSQVPGVDPAMLVRLGGGAYPDELDRTRHDQSSTGFLFRLPKTVSRFVRENFRLQQRVETFEEFFAQERARIDALDPRLLSPNGLSRMLNNVEWLLDETGSVMLTVYARLLVSVLVLLGLLRFIAGSRAMELQRLLLSGLEDVDSAAPGFALCDVANVAEHDTPARELIVSRAPSELTLEQLPPGPTKVALGRFMDAYGHRGVREPEIAAPRWAEDPTMLFAALRLHLTNDEGLPLVALSERQKTIRDEAEAEVMQLVPLVTRPALRRLLEAVRRLTRTRERLRGRVIEVLGMYRRVALDASRRLESQEPEAGSDAAFFLTVEELRHVLESSTEHVSLFVQRRRAEFDRNRALPDPPGTFVGYPPPIDSFDAETRLLRGLAASAGTAEGKARVLGDPGDAIDLRPGEVLVVPAADVGWAPLFPTAVAVVTELGGPLSHAAIVLREYGVPAVVNVHQATAVIRNGDLVRVDGEKGEVELLGVP